MIKYNNEDKTPNDKGWIISKKQILEIQEKVSEWETTPTMEQIEVTLLALCGEIDLLKKWKLTKEDLKGKEENK